MITHLSVPMSSASGMVGRYPAFTKSRTLSSFRSPSSWQNDIVLELEGSERASQSQFRRRVSLPSQPFVAKSSSSKSYSYSYSYKWDDAQKWISSPMGNANPARTNRTPSHTHTGHRTHRRSRNAASVVVREVVFEELSVNKYREEEEKRKSPGPGVTPGNKLVGSTVNLSRYSYDPYKALGPRTTSDCCHAPPPTTGKSIFLRDAGTEMTPSRAGSPVSEKPSESKESVKLHEMKENSSSQEVEVEMKSAADIHADALEDAEKSKYMARFKREEARIQAWEDGLKEKAEAELMKIEAKVERMRSHAHKAFRSKLAAAKKKAEEKHAAAVCERERQAERVARKAEYIRTNGRIPSWWSWRC